MSSFAFKKPINAFYGPVYPDVKKDILNFKSSKRFWQVDAGTEVKYSQLYPFFIEDAIEYQSRDRNENMYGKSAHRTYVNEQVVYPLVSPWDLECLSRKPRTTVVPRANPSSRFLSMDNMFNGIESHIENRISTQR